MTMTSAVKPSRPYLWIALGMVVHALTVLLVWITVFHFDIEVMPARLWLVSAWLWLFWPLAMFLHPARFRGRLLAPLAVSVALLWPCIGTVYTFTAWTITGFAP
jgi:hypothetical protein